MKYTILYSRYMLIKRKDICEVPEGSLAVLFWMRITITEANIWILAVQLVAVWGGLGSMTLQEEACFEVSKDLCHFEFVLLLLLADQDGSS